MTPAQETFRTQRGEVVSFNVSPQAPCPCESGLPAESCCLTSNGFVTKATATTPPDPQTGSSCQGCYAESLRDCGPRLSREHFISGSILSLLNGGEQVGLKVDGFPWQEHNCVQFISPQALAARVLCERHNSALSGLDSVATRFLRALDEKAAVENSQDLLHLFNGHDVERWLLKVLCGLAASGNIEFERPTTLSVPVQWIEILFGAKSCRPGQGLYVCRSKGTKFKGQRGVAISPVGQEGQLMGVVVWICGYELILAMTPPKGRQLLGREVAYRPMEFHVTGPEHETSVVFCGESPADNGTIHLRIGDA